MFQAREIGSLRNDTEKEGGSLLSRSEYGCDYPGPPPPPPLFQLPPPPRPPFLAIVPNCLDIDTSKNESCDNIMTVINAKYYGNPNTTSTTVTLLVVCFALSLAGVFVVFTLTRERKKKILLNLANKSALSACNTAMHANRVTHENLTDVRMQATQFPRPMDVATIVKSHHNTRNYTTSYSVVLMRSATGQAVNEYCLPLPPQDYRCCSQGLRNSTFEKLSND